MAEIEGRCTQCSEENTDHKKPSELRNGTGATHGTEYLHCSECGSETLHNRCGKSVPTAQQ